MSRPRPRCAIHGNEHRSPASVANAVDRAWRRPAIAAAIRPPRPGRLARTVVFDLAPQPHERLVNSGHLSNISDWTYMQAAKFLPLSLSDLQPEQQISRPEGDPTGSKAGTSLLA